MRRGDGRLIRSTRQGRGDIPAYCDDYAATAVAMFTLYQSTGEDEWYRHGAEITADMVDLFWDSEHGGFFATGSDAERLIARPKNLFDNPTPSDNALGAEALAHMAAYTGDAGWWDRLDTVLRLGQTFGGRHAESIGHLLAVGLVATAPPVEVAVVGRERSHLTDVVRAQFRPEVFLAEGDGTGESVVPLLSDRATLDGAATAYPCRGWVCDAPTTDPEVLEQSLPPPVRMG
jgi:uncharacterized protein